MSTLKCRPSEADKDPVLAFMSATQMLALKVKNGDTCNITHHDDTTTVVAWLTSKADLKEGVIGISKWMQDKAGIKLGNEIHVAKSLTSVKTVTTLNIKGLDDVDPSKTSLWAQTAAVMIPESHRYLATSQIVEIAVGRQKKRFEVLGQVNDVFKAASIEAVKISDASIDLSSNITFDKIGALAKQKEELRDIISAAISSSGPKLHFSSVSHATGILLYGPAGTGKSLLRRAIESEFEWSSSMTWDGAGSKLPVNIPEAQLVHITITSKLTAQDAKVLEQTFRSLPRTTVILGEVRDPNDIQSFLRTGSTFRDEIEIPIPDSRQRHEILSVLHDGLLKDQLLEETAQRTHGYVGDDLDRLLGKMSLLTSKSDDPTSNGMSVQVNGQATAFTSSQVNGTEQDIPAKGKHPTTRPTSEHLTAALTQVRPSALQHVFLEKPNIRWSDIGGQETFKDRLRTAVEWPLKYPGKLARYNVPPKKGILLYGPPGCSKTMLVKALATESDYNFLAVKGAELISMYVGESERATRDVFKKARAASPCIIFFDEIDAIARRASGSSELNVLTTLLNEMDGFEELKNVLVIAATNKPQSIDPALMRPGRFDNVVYIGPPDHETRKAIILEQLKKMPSCGPQYAGFDEHFADLSDGMSGAEIVAACQSAREAVVQREITTGQSSEVTMDDLNHTFTTQPRSITHDMLQEYEVWNAERGR